MATAAATRVFEVDVPPLRVFLHLDTEALHPNVLDKLIRYEGRADYVDADLPRDFEDTEEVIAATIGAALVDSDGEIRYELDGPDAATRVSRAKETAKVEVSLSFDEPKAARPAGRTPRPDVAVDQPAPGVYEAPDDEVQI